MTLGAPQGSRQGHSLWFFPRGKCQRGCWSLGSQTISWSLWKDKTSRFWLKWWIQAFREVRHGHEEKLLHRWQYLFKAAAVVGTKRIYYRMPRLIIDGSEIQWKNQLTYLGVELDRQLWFGTHIHKVVLKAFGTAGYLARLMQSLGVPKALIRRLNKQNSLQSQILYIAPVWTKALEERLTRETWNELICLPHQESILDDRRKEQALLDLKRQARDRLHKKLRHKWDQDTAGRWA